MAQTSYCQKAFRYIDSVLNGTAPACKWTKAACDRQKRDLSRKDWEYRFDVRQAERVCGFIECLPHIKGKWAGKTIQLEGWQCFLLTTAFGWVNRKTGLRRFRTVYIEVPRKNAKSTLSSGVGLYMLVADGEEGAEIYSAATTREQARIVFDVAQSMVEKTPDLQGHYGVQPNAHSISMGKTSSKFTPLSAETNSLDGLNIHCAIVDELHAHKSRRVWDVIDTATGARSQPLIWAITTAGVNRASVCWDQRLHVIDILNGVRDDDSYFGVIYTIDDEDNPFDEAAWTKANPNYGISVYPANIRSKSSLAESMPSAMNAFLTKHLNVWVNAAHSWIDIRKWEACGDRTLNIRNLGGEPAYIGIDLAQRSDMAAAIILFPPSGDRPYCVFGKYYLPESVVRRTENSHYQGWVRAGRLTATEGEVIDYDFILEDVLRWLDSYDVQIIGYDPWKSTSLVNNFQGRGVQRERIVEIRQTTAVMSPAMKELESLILSKKIRHDGDPILQWMLSNVVCKRDAKDNLYPLKEGPEKKIDGILALLMALDRANRDVEETPDFTEGLFVI